MSRRVRKTSRFKKDFKRLARNAAFCAEFASVLRLLVDDMPLPSKYSDHALCNNWDGCRDCHIRPDVVLIYEKTDDGIELLLMRIGSHSELFR